MPNKTQDKKQPGHGRVEESHPHEEEHVEHEEQRQDHRQPPARVDAEERPAGGIRSIFCFPFIGFFPSAAVRTRRNETRETNRFAQMGRIVPVKV